MKPLFKTKGFWLFCALFIASSANAQSFFDFEIEGKHFGRDRTTYGIASRLFHAIGYPSEERGGKHYKFVGLKKDGKWEKFLECADEMLPPFSIRRSESECVILKELNQEQLGKLFESLDDSLIQPMPRPIPVGVALTKKAVGNFLWQLAVSKRCPLLRPGLERNCKYGIYTGRPDEWVFNNGDEPEPTKEKVVIQGNDAKVVWDALARHLKAKVIRPNRATVQYVIEEGRFGCSKTVFAMLGPDDAAIGYRPPKHECVIEPR